MRQRPPRVWLPGLLLPAAAAFVAGVSLRAHDYPRYAYWVQLFTLRGAAAACLALAAALALSPRWREASAAHLDALSEAPAGRHLAWLAAAYAGLFAWFGFIRWCQYRGYELTQDTAWAVGHAHAFLRHGSFLTLSGCHGLAVHFSALMPLLSPALLFWDHPLALLALHHALVVSAPLAAYALGWSLCRSSLAGAATALLALSAPEFSDLAGANVYAAPLAVFFLWGLAAWGEGRRAAAGLMLAAMLLTHEMAPFPLAGAALAWALPRRRWAAGAGLTLACAAAFALQVLVVRRYEALEPVAVGTVPRSLLFAHLAPAGAPAKDILGLMLAHPAVLLRHLVSSPFAWFPALRLLGSTGFLALLAPEQLAYWTAVLPQVLANPGRPAALFSRALGGFPGLQANDAAYAFGPLLWATAYGVRRLDGRLRERGARPWLLVAALAAAAPGFARSRPILLKDWSTPWFDEAPPLLALVPPRARVWSLDLLSAPLSARRWLRMVFPGAAVPAADGYQRLFAPDWVVLTREWVAVTGPPYRDAVLTFLSRGGYAKAGDGADVLVLRSPTPAADPDAVPEWVRLPEPDAADAAAYARYLLSASPRKD